MQTSREVVGMLVVECTQFSKCKHEKNSFAQLLFASCTSGLKIGSCKHFLFQKQIFFQFICGFTMV